MGLRLDPKSILDFTKIDPSTWSDADKVEKLVDRLPNVQKIITSQGEFNRLNWSKQTDTLASQSQNPAKAKILNDAFEDAFREMPEGSKKADIRTFIQRNQIFIGLKKPTFDFSKSSINNLVNGKFTARFERFLDLVSENMKRHYDQNQAQRDTNKVAVAILTCSSGGGHRMVAESMKNLLEEQPDKYEAKIINIDDLPGDSINIVTNGAVKSHHIFSQFRCQENDHHKAGIYSDLKIELHQFIPSTAMDRVNCEIQKFGADIVLNTIHQEINGVSPYADLGIPVAFVNTDYELPPQLQELRENVQTDHLKIFTPIDYQLKGVDGVVPIGFPIRKGFERKITLEEKQNLRKKYTVKEDESLVVVQMGSLAMGMDKEIDQLIEDTTNLKKRCHFVFLCGTNQKALKAVNQAVDKLGANEKRKIFFHPEAMLNDSQLSALYQTCDAVVGKPGGATTAEIAATGAFLLAYDPLPWEKPNLEYLESRNQGREIDSFKDLAKFLSEPAKTRTETKAPEVLNWKENFVREINDTVQRKPQKDSTTADAGIRVNNPYSNSKLRQLFTRYFRRTVNSIGGFFKFIIYIAKILMQDSLSTWIRRLRRWWKYA